MRNKIIDTTLLLVVAGCLIFLSKVGGTPKPAAPTPEVTPSGTIKETSLAGQKRTLAEQKEEKKRDQKPTKATTLPSGRNKPLSSKAQLFDLEKCYEKEGSCGFPLSDPKAEFFAIGQEIKKELLKLQFEAQSNKTKSAELSDIARHFLKSPDGHVKEAALHLMSTQEPSEENLNSLLQEVIGHYDAKLIQHGLLELTRYLGQGYDQRIHQALSQAMAQGAPFVSVEIAKGLPPFINNGSYAYYSNVLSQLGPGSKTKQLLKVNLEEFQRKQSAG